MSNTFSNLWIVKNLIVFSDFFGKLYYNHVYFNRLDRQRTKNSQISFSLSEENLTRKGYRTYIYLFLYKKKRTNKKKYVGYSYGLLQDSTFLIKRQTSDYEVKCYSDPQ